MTAPERDEAGGSHGNVFGRGWGDMFIHVQRASGLAHRTLVLSPWQVQALRLVASRWFAIILTATVLSWGYFAVQTARVPFLTRRIAHLEKDAAKIDTLQATLEQLQRRYDQVQQMLSASTKPAQAAPGAEMKSTAESTKPPTKPPTAPPTAPPARPLGKTPDKAADKAPAKPASKAPESSPRKLSDTTSVTKSLTAH